jgi:hypothetical protein
MFKAVLVVIGTLAVSTFAVAHDDFGENNPGTVTKCQKAPDSEMTEILSGQQKYDSFIEQCKGYGIEQKWCEQLTHPNQNSKAKFECTYGDKVPHILIHPDESTWINAFKAAKLVQRLIQENIRVVEIYNWWRPAQYNKNVGGSKTRHPFAVSVDIRMSSKPAMEAAHKKLCAWRKKGDLRAIGYYDNTGLHLGIDDEVPNTWGKSCN